MTEQLNSPRVKEYTNVSRLVPVQVKMSKKSSLARGRSFTLRFSKKQKYCCQTSKGHPREDHSTQTHKAVYRRKREDAASEAAI